MWRIAKVKTMVQGQATFADLPYEILKEILVRVAKSSNGSKNLANAISVCKDFHVFVEDIDILRAVDFGDLLISGRWELFQLKEGLVTRCAQAGQTEAQFILGKIILVSTSYLLDTKTKATIQNNDDNLPEENTLVSSYMSNFLPDRTTHPHFIGFHFDFVKHFLCQARLSEFEEMKRHLNNYMKYYIGCVDYDREELLMYFQVSFDVKAKIEDMVTFCIDVSRKLQLKICKLIQILILHLKIEQQIGSNVLKVCAIDTERCVHGKETFDLLLKRVKVLEAAIIELRIIKVNVEDAHGKKHLEVLASCLSIISALGKKLESTSEVCKSIASREEEYRGHLLSNFEAFLFCEVLAKHHHDLECPLSFLSQVLSQFVQ